MDDAKVHIFYETKEDFEEKDKIIVKIGQVLSAFA